MAWNRRQEEEAIDALLDGYMHAGKLPPAQREAAKRLAGFDVEALN
jgi:hypothetical protein